ncbi:MAG: hypothetical protein ACK40Y_01230 [Cloacibacterium caeni]
MKKIFTTIFLCAGLFIYAQTGTVSGNINDNSKIALPGAKITLSPGNIYTVSDEYIIGETKCKKNNRNETKFFIKKTTPFK